MRMLPQKISNLKPACRSSGIGHSMVAPVFRMKRILIGASYFLG